MLQNIRAEFRARLTAARATAANRLERVDAAYSEYGSCHGSHPFRDCSLPSGIIGRIWEPLLAAFSKLERRDEILIASEWQNQPWVVGMRRFGEFS